MLERRKLKTIQIGQYAIPLWLIFTLLLSGISGAVLVNYIWTAKEVEDAFEMVFFDDFNWGVAEGWTEHSGAWSVIGGEYFVEVGIVENGISTVNTLNLTDCIIEAKLRFGDTSVGYRAGIVFGYVNNQHYYAFESSKEYDVLHIFRYSPHCADYGERIGLAWAYTIRADINYTLKTEIHDDTFTCYLNGENVITGKDSSYRAGKVGLKAIGADVYFDNFTVYSLP
jgi:hypothetical protein